MKKKITELKNLKWFKRWKRLEGKWKRKRWEEVAKENNWREIIIYKIYLSYQIGFYKVKLTLNFHNRYEWNLMSLKSGANIKPWLIRRWSSTPLGCLCLLPYSSNSKTLTSAFSFHVSRFSLSSQSPFLLFFSPHFTS